MKSLIFHAFLIALVALLVLGGCDDRFDLAQLPDPGQSVALGDTNYVEIYPPWVGFDSPQALLVGSDQLIYVADYAQNEVVMMDAGGTVVGRKSVPHPVCLAQNSKLDLYVGGEAIAPNGVDTIGAIYRIYLVRFDTTYVSRIDTTINTSTGDTVVTETRRDTSFFANHSFDAAVTRTVWQEPARPGRRFTGVGIIPGNGYLVARTGPDNSSFVDPDSRVLLFNDKDILETPLGDLVTRPSGGTAITDIRNLTGILIFPSSRDFILTQTSDGIAYGAVWMVYQSTADFQGWLPKYDPTRADQRGVDFILPNRYQNAVAAAFDRRRREIFVLDSELDSVVKFNRNGQFRSESFGHVKSGSDILPGIKNPRGIAFSNDCTLYIADTGNKLIRRFRLSTQTTCN
jgi:hypothetical protein